MRIEKITDNRVKVTLTAADLIHLDINVEHLTPDSKELHTFLFNLMETIREETDFNPYSGQVVVEATPVRDGISVIVSKLGEKAYLTREQFRKIKSIKPKAKQLKTSVDMFCFDDFEILCEALSNLAPEDLSRSGLYRQGDMYCVVSKSMGISKHGSYILREFAKRILPKSVKEEHIIEHWELVAEKDELIKMTMGIQDLKNQ